MDKEKKLNVAIVGGGPGCKAIMDIVFAEELRQLSMKLVGVSDIDPNAVGYRFAKKKGIFTTRDYRDLFRIEGLDLIIELTGNLNISDEISRLKPHHVRLMDHVSARLFWDVFHIKEEAIEERERAEEELMRAYDQLEVRVQNRTAKLKKISEELTLELAERKRAEEALKKSEKKSRQVGMELATGLSEVFGALGEISSGNPEVRISEDSQLELIGKLKRIVNITAKNLGEIIDLSHEFAIGLAEHFDTLAKVTKGDLTARVSGESNIELVARLGKMTNQMIDSVTTEIRRRKIAEEAFRRAHQEMLEKANDLESANEELSQYDHVVAHVLKAPLRAIRHYADFLREDLSEKLPDGCEANLDGLIKAVQEGVELVDDLLQFSTVGRSNQPPQEIQPAEFLEKLVLGISFPCDIDIARNNNWPTLKANKSLLKQIFVELIRNGNKFNHSEKKRVEIGCTPSDGDKFEFFVRDNGIGIDPRYHEKIFSVFERLHNREEYDGTGLGLAIVKKATTRLGGTIRVESTMGEGTTFFVTLPERPKED